jgi:hypothetical protein
VRIKFLIVIFLSLLCNITTAQTFNYSYTDPCNGKVYNLSIPYGQNQIAVTYYGQVNTFTANDFNNGAFDNWAAGVFNQYKNASPCGSIGTAVTVSQTQSTALNVISIFGALSAISDMASSGTGNIMAAAGSVNNVGGGKGDSKPSDNKKENKNGDNSSGSTTSGGSGSGSNGSSNNTENNNGSNGSSGSGGTTGSGASGGSTGSSGSGEQAGGSSASGGTTGSGASGGTTGSGEKTGESSGATNNNPGGSGASGGTTNNGSGGSGGTTTSGSGSGGGTGNGSTPNQTDGGSDKKSDAVGGTTNAVKSGSSSNSKGSATSKNGGRPSILMSSDLVGFQFNEGEVSKGSKVNAGYSSVRYDGLRSHGVMVDYTSSIQGGNITGYYAWINRKAITLLSNTVTIGFTGSGSMYNTIAFGQMRSIKKFKAVYMLTASAGQIYKESYYGSAAIVGGNRDFKVGKRIDIKTMALFVYAPFVRYYDDAVLKSPFVILPIVGMNLGVTKTFKLNFNFGGAYSIGDNVLNYTVMIGTRLAL